MKILEETYFLLPSVVAALKTHEEGKNISDERRTNIDFCTSLQSVLKDVVAWHPTDENFDHAYELRLVIQAVSQHMQQFSDAVKPVMSASQQPIAQHGTGVDTDRQNVLQLQSSVVQQVDTLRKQVSSAVLSNPSPSRESMELMSEEQRLELQAIGVRARITFSHDHDQSPEASSAQSLGIKDQEGLLISMRRDAELHWDSAQLIVHSPWGDAAHLMSTQPSEVKVPRPPMVLPEDPPALKGRGDGKPGMNLRLYHHIQNLPKLIDSRPRAFKLIKTRE
ncbi:hypothetical protein PG991_003826 [Apiospora marii]|uniref:Uncharacterized protein n=1 Tax=Apiospora marii TaxID=335849 RepID=A0ABR1S4J0_9PEZI